MAELQASGARCKFLALCQLLRICFLETVTTATSFLTMLNTMITLRPLALTTCNEQMKKWIYCSSFAFAKSVTASSVLPSGLG